MFSISTMASSTRMPITRVRPRSVTTFRLKPTALMNAKAAELGLTDSHFVRPDGLDAPGEYSSARDVTRLAVAAMKLPAVREAVREESDSLADGTPLHTWNDLLSTFPGLLGVKTGHTNGAGWSEVAAAKEVAVDLTVRVAIVGRAAASTASGNTTNQG